MPLGAVLARIRAVRLRPILAVLLLLASGTQAFAASRDAECARHDGARQDAVVAAAMNGTSIPIVDNDHHHSPDRHPPAEAAPGPSCASSATVARSVDAPAPTSPASPAAEHAAQPETQRPGALFRPPRTI